MAEVGEPLAGGVSRLLSTAEELKNEQASLLTGRPTNELRVLTFNLLADCWVNVGGDAGRSYYSTSYPDGGGETLPLEVLEADRRSSAIAKTVRAQKKERTYFSP